MADANIPSGAQEDINRDLGLGSRISQASRRRLLNRDGSFNTVRIGLPFYRTQNLYHAVLTMSWARFILLIAGWYVGANLIFATAYMLCGPDALHGVDPAHTIPPFWEGFFFSVQTLSTIGYGAVSPHGLAPNIIVSIEALTGLLAFALVTGILFARFSRPVASLLYSSHAVIAPYRGGKALMFRIANTRSNEIVDLGATLTLARMEADAQGKLARKFYSLPLERQKVVFFPTQWVVVHAIDETSPLAGATPESLRTTLSEFLVLITGTDETFSQTVHSRSSYYHDEILFDTKFSDMFTEKDGTLGIDLRKIHDTEPA